MTPFGRMMIRPAAAILALLAGLILRLLPHPPVSGNTVWMVGLWLTGSPLLFRAVRDVFRRHFATDLVASLAIATALALAQPFAGLIIVLMQTGGEALERFAEHRATEAVRDLEAQAPHQAHRLAGTAVADVAAEQVEVGEEILVRPGEMVPCDGVVVSGTAQVDASRLTGESLPRRASAGAEVRSGMLVLDGPLTVRTTARAAASLYARIVELVRTAQASKAPLQRIADRYAVWFTPVTLLVAAAAYLATRDPLRVLAVLVVATPCPLILATPVAIIGGINRAARRQIVIRHGGALEALAAVDAAVFDKTGTLTVGHPEVVSVDALPPFGPEELLRLAGSLETGSGHPLARTLVDEAVRRGITLPRPEEVTESAGRGVWGTVEGRRVTVGAFSLIRERNPGVPLSFDGSGSERPSLRAYVAVDGLPAGQVTYADRLRPGAAAAVAELRRIGVGRIALLSGDQARNASGVAKEVGITEVAGDLLPEEKARRIQQLGKEAHRVLMVGDGTNDAPALSTASVGLALAGHGGGIAAEAADVVVLVDDLSRVPEAVAVGRRTLRIARQGILIGLGLSGAAMLVAAGGYLSPPIGALFQEAIDVAVILNALRARGAGRPVKRTSA